LIAETFEFVVPTTTNANRFQFTEPSTTNSNWKIIYNNVTSGVPRQPIAPLPPPPPPNPGPPAALLPGGTIVFAELVHDFGKAIGGEILKWDFIFTNTAKDTLTLSEVRPGCGCTVVGAWTRSVAPGHIGVIPVQLNTANFTGHLSKNITVTCSDSNHSTVNLTVKANIWRPIEVSPQWAILNVNSETPSNAAIIKILSNLEQPIDIRTVDCPNPALATDLLTVQPGKEYQLVIRTVPPYPTNTQQAAIKLFTSSTNMPMIPVTAWVNYQPTLVAIPAKVFVSTEPRTATFTNTVWLRNSGTNLITFAQPSCNREDVKVELNAIQEGRVYRVDLIFPTWFQMSPIEKVQLEIKTTHPDYPVITVPIEIKPAPGQIIPRPLK
jgi:hypothetical protein